MNQVLAEMIRVLTWVHTVFPGHLILPNDYGALHPSSRALGYSYVFDASSASPRRFIRFMTYLRIECAVNTDLLGIHIPHAGIQYGQYWAKVELWPTNVKTLKWFEDLHFHMWRGRGLQDWSWKEGKWEPPDTIIPEEEYLDRIRDEYFK